MMDMSQIGSLFAGWYLLMTIFQQLFVEEFRQRISKYFAKVTAYFDPYININFNEYQGEDFIQSKTYLAIQRYLTHHSSTRARRLRANDIWGCKSVVLSMDDYEEITDEFKGIKVWWTSIKLNPPSNQSFYYYGEKRYYKLTCHKKHRVFITNVYMQHVVDEGKAIELRTRQRKLYTNIKDEDLEATSFPWRSIIFEHPSTFDTLAMNPDKKKAILNDLTKFSKSKDYYKSIGKAWKRGYLLYGPPGTGKSSMIAAMSNFLNYDIYDIELTSIKSNTSLRRLLIHTKSKSIIVIEDIDCSLDLTGQRKNEQAEKVNDKEKKEDYEKKKASEVTLSGLLNFIDGLWSACGSERVIVFTTNHVEKLDLALIRRGRMDMHIEMSYCCYESFKVLAKNYLYIESHELFETIGRLLEVINMSPADVAENLISKSDEEDVECCLNNLIKALEDAKEKQQKPKVIDQEAGEEKVQEESNEKLANSTNEGDNKQAQKDYGESIRQLANTDEGDKLARKDDGESSREEPKCQKNQTEPKPNPTVSGF